MPDNKRNIAWGQVVISGLITALFSFVVGILLFYYTSKSPDLIYEVFPPAYFTKQTTQISIYSARIENVGSKEADDVQVSLGLPSSSNIQDLKVEPSPTNIPHTILQVNTPNTREIRIPSLNHGESFRFVVLVDKGEAAQLTIQVRGRGVTGHVERTERSSIPAILAFLAGLVSSIAGIVAVIFVRGRSEQRIDEVLTSQNRLLDHELRLVRTRDKMSRAQLTEILLATPFRLFFNPNVPGLSKTKIMRFGKDGAILEGRNDNESSWRIRGDFLELVNSGGGVHSRFYYSPIHRSFYHTNDPDTGSIQKHGIRDQYMVPDETPNH